MLINLFTSCGNKATNYEHMGMAGFQAVLPTLVSFVQEWQVFRLFWQF